MIDGVHPQIGPDIDGVPNHPMSPSGTSTAEMPTAFDPFLVLNNDLDDVSEVIKHNIMTDESSATSTPPSSGGKAENAQLDKAWTQTGLTPPNSSDPGKERQIGQIVSLLQQPDNPPTLEQSPPGPNLNKQFSVDDQLLDCSPVDPQHGESLLLHHAGFQNAGFEFQNSDPKNGITGQHDPLISGGGMISPLSLQHNQPGIVLEQQQSAEYVCEIDGIEFEQYQQQQQLLQQQLQLHNATFVDADPAQLQQQQFGEQNMSTMSEHGVPMTESPPPLEQRNIKQELTYAPIMDNDPPFYHQTDVVVEQHCQLEAAVAAKNELIRMLLEMSPQELEHLRAQRTRQHIIQQHNHQQQQQQQLLYHPTTMVVQQQQPQFYHPQLEQQLSLDDAQLQQQNMAGNGTLMEFNNVPAQQFCASASTTSSSALTSPVAAYDPMSLAPSEYFGEEDSAMEELWGTEDGDMTTMEEGGKVPEEQDGRPKEKTGRRRAHKTERRTAHNLIEKKYRCSINDRINQLKEMLASEETAKLSKSATLRRAVDHIFMLRTKNAELSGENARLRQTLEMAGLAAVTAPKQPAMTTVKQENCRSTAGVGAVTAGNVMNKTPRRRASSSARKNAVNAVGSSDASPPSTGAGPNKDQSRVTMCVFMFMLLAFNPLSSLLLGDGGGGGNGVEQYTQHNSAAAISEPMFAHHRTLREDARFSAIFAEGTAPPASSSPPSHWWSAPFVRHTLIWLLNSLFVFLVLTRLLVYGDPVADRRSPRWGAFLESHQKAEAAVTSGNYKEAQRELGEALQILERPLPHSGSVDEWMSLTWQIIRHLLNGLWIGRWFARRRRPSVPRHSVCRSHAATAFVYHQLHQLHLLDVDGIGLTSRGALNLTLSAANLAESAGSSAVSHSLRAEIYLCAALRSLLCLPKCIRRVVSAYFFRRAKRHVRKSAALEGAQMPSLQWMSHPLARCFLARPEHIAAILSASGAQRTPNFPFSVCAQSPKPVEVLRDAFKMHLLGQLLSQLGSPEGKLRMANFVEQSHLLLNICEADTDGADEQKTRKGNNRFAAGGNDMLRPNLSEGDRLCAWWAHLVSGGLHWRHGDLKRAQQHYGQVRNCPRDLAQNDLALALGLAFCTRKMCFEDRQKGKFAEVVVWHVRRANAHLKRGGTWTTMAADKGGRPRAGTLEGMVSRGATIGESVAVQRQFRLLCCQWLLCSLLDVWSFCFAHCGLIAPLDIRRLYADVIGRMEREWAEGGTEGAEKDEEKMGMFRELGRTLCGGIHQQHPIAQIALQCDQNGGGMPNGRGSA